MDATMCMKLKIAIENQGVDGFLAYTENKGLITVCVGSFLTSGELKTKVSPTMFMKTKENESDKWAYPTMLMKRNRLNFFMPRCL